MERFKLPWLSILILAIPLLSSCSLQKRHYRRGYYMLCLDRTSESSHCTNNPDSSVRLLNDPDYRCEATSSIDSIAHFAIVDTVDCLSLFNTTLTCDNVTEKTDSENSLELVT